MKFFLPVCFVLSALVTFGLSHHKAYAETKTQLKAAAAVMLLAAAIMVMIEGAKT